jgi:hypothetical protein
LTNEYIHGIIRYNQKQGERQMTERILLGKVKDNFNNGSRCYVAGEFIYLHKASWDCDWYWGFGYLSDKYKRLHTHFDGNFLQGSEYAHEIFESTKITDDEWWVIRDLFIQAYALRKTAEVYRYGGHQTFKEGVTNIIKNEEMCTKLNADLKLVLDKIWNMLVKIDNK